MDFKKEGDYGRYCTESLFDFINNGIKEESYALFPYTKSKRQLSRGEKIFKIIETAIINYEKETLHSLFNNNNKKAPINVKNRL